MEKISTVRKEKTQLVKQELKKKGLPELLADINISYKDSDTGVVKLTKYHNAIKKMVKETFLQSPLEKRLSFVNDALFQSDIQIQVEAIEDGYDTAFRDYLKRLVKRCSNIMRSAEEAEIVKVIVRNGSQTHVGYSLLNGEIKKAFAWTERALVGFPYQSLLLLDLPTLLADILTSKTLFAFIHKNPENIRYLFIRNFLANSQQTKKRIPFEAQFRSDFLALADKYRFDYKDAQPDAFVDAQKRIFYEVGSTHIDLKRKVVNHPHFVLAIDGFLQLTEQAKNTVKNRLDERDNYARSPETKKHIKNSHKKRMDLNRFLTHYGYVELDNEVDLDKFATIEANFDTLVKFLSIPVRKDYSFRIKKLGKLHAAGVFYPSYKCTIFDIDHPDAYVHECMHQIDHILAESLEEDFHSETLHFQRIYDLYKQLVTAQVNALPEDHPFRKEWNGKNKFNKAYFLTPTEVFARAGEVYVASKKFPPNSLFKELKELKNRPEYVVDPVFIDIITPYFDKLLQFSDRKIAQ